jgi:hypothetical protein
MHPEGARHAVIATWNWEDDCERRHEPGHEQAPPFHLQPAVPSCSRLARAIGEHTDPPPWKWNALHRAERGPAPAQSPRNQQESGNAAKKRDCAYRMRSAVGGSSGGASAYLVRSEDWEVGLERERGGERRAAAMARRPQSPPCPTSSREVRDWLKDGGEAVLFYPTRLLPESKKISPFPCTWAFLARGPLKTDWVRSFPYLFLFIITELFLS